MIPQRLQNLAPYFLLLVLCAIGCRREVPNHETACLGGSLPACAKACEAGIYGEGGCLAAAKVTNPIRKTAMYTRACQGKQPGACLKAAQASILVSLSNPKQYQSLLEQSCALNNPKGCEKLGDFFLTDSLERAKDAYAKGCQIEAKADCGKQLNAFLKRLAENNVACNIEYQPGACESLLDQLARKNHDAAYRAAQQLCEVRGLSEHYRKSRMPFDYRLRKRRKEYQPCGLFLLARAATDPERKSGFQRTALPPADTPDAGGRVTLTALELFYRTAPSPSPEQIVESKANLRGQLEPRLKLAQRCYNELLSKLRDVNQAPGGKVSANFLIDKLGGTSELRASSEWASRELLGCVASAAIPEKFETGKIAAPTHVDASFELRRH